MPHRGSAVLIYAMRTQDIKRKFNTVLDVGAGPGHFSKLLPAQSIGHVHMIDLSGTKTLQLMGPVIVYRPTTPESILHRDPPSDFEG